MLSRILLVLFLTASISICLAAEIGPPSFQVQSDWKKVCKDDPCCRDQFSIRSINVIGNEVVSADHVRVLVEISGVFMYDRKCGLPGGPVYGIKRDGSVKLRKIMVYHRYENQWNLENWFAAERNY